MTKWTKIEDYRLDVVPFDDFDDIDTVNTARLHDCVFPDYMIADREHGQTRNGGVRLQTLRAWVSV